MEDGVHLHSSNDESGENPPVATTDVNTLPLSIKKMRLRSDQQETHITQQYTHIFFSLCIRNARPCGGVNYTAI